MSPIELVATLQAALGDLDGVRHIVKLLVLVNSAPGFCEPHEVANGASELLAEVFGERGAHARTAFGRGVPHASSMRQSPDPRGQGSRLHEGSVNT
jgi:enamine deaminase RidA (YjgF/YER057c/UK114 family)